jgi:hypothetical protein
MILTLAMFFSLIVPQATSNLQARIRCFGSVSYGTSASFTVNVDFGNQTMSNSFRLGTQINEWRWLLITGCQELRDACKALNFGYMRDITIGRFQPCKSWDPSKNTGTYDWRDFDALIEFIRWCGAEPIITLESDGISGMTGAGLNRLPDPIQFGVHCQNVIRHCNQNGYETKYFDLTNEAYFNYSPEELCNWYNIVQGYCYAEDESILLGQSACHRPQFFDYYVDHIQGLKWFPYHGYTDWPANSGTADGTILSRAEDLSYGALNTRVRTPKEMREMWHSKHGEWLDAICIETNMNSGFDATYGTDPRMQQIFGAVYWAEITRSRILDGARGAVWYEYCSYDLTLKNPPCQGGRGLGMIDMYAPFEEWYPYCVNWLYGNNLKEGDGIYESASSDFENISSLAWKDGSEYKLLLIGKTNTTFSVQVNFQGIEVQKAKVQAIEGTGDPENVVGSIKESSTSAPLRLTLSGYCVVLLSAST